MSREGRRPLGDLRENLRWIIKNQKPEYDKYFVPIVGESTV